MNVCKKAHMIALSAQSPLPQQGRHVWEVTLLSFLARRRSRAGLSTLSGVGGKKMSTRATADILSGTHGFESSDLNTISIPFSRGHFGQPCSGEKRRRATDPIFILY